MDDAFTQSSQLRFALDDMVKGWQMRRLWLTLAWDDLRIRYQRSVLGQIWITLGTAFFITVVSYLWSDIMDRDGNVLVPWLTTGLILWQLISAAVTEGATTFTRGAGIIQNISMPLSIHVYRIVMRHVFNYLHNFILIIVVMILYPHPLSVIQLLFFPGLLIVIITAVAASLLFGIIGARFRDFSHTVTMVMTPVFFLTPIMWMPTMLSGIRLQIMNLNPFTHFLAIVREPLLGRLPTPLNYGVTLVILMMLILFSIYLLSRCRTKLPYWI